MIPNTLTLQHERVDDIPLLLGLMQQLHLPETLEHALGSHHLHQGISSPHYSETLAKSEAIRKVVGVL